MNTQLVNSLVEIIQSLSEEERAFLQEKLNKSDGQTSFQRLIALGNRINARRGGEAFEPPSEELIRQMREARDEQLINTGSI